MNVASRSGSVEKVEMRTQRGNPSGRTQADATNPQGQTWNSDPRDPLQRSHHKAQLTIRTTPRKKLWRMVPRATRPRSGYSRYLKLIAAGTLCLFILVLSPHTDPENHRALISVNEILEDQTKIQGLSGPEAAEALQKIGSLNLHPTAKIKKVDRLLRERVRTLKHERKRKLSSSALPKCDESIICDMIQFLLMWYKDHRQDPKALDRLRKELKEPTQTVTRILTERPGYESLLVDYFKATTYVPSRDKCSECNGTRKKNGQECETCRGTGIILPEAEVDLSLRLPESGTIFRTTHVRDQLINMAFGAGRREDGKSVGRTYRSNWKKAVKFYRQSTGKYLYVASINLGKTRKLLKVGGCAILNSRGKKETVLLREVTNHGWNITILSGSRKGKKFINVHQTVLAPLDRDIHVFLPKGLSGIYEQLSKARGKDAYHQCRFGNGAQQHKLILNGSGASQKFLLKGTAATAPASNWSRKKTWGTWEITDNNKLIDLKLTRYECSSTHTPDF